MGVLKSCLVLDFDTPLLYAVTTQRNTLFMGLFMIQATLP